VGGQLLWFSNTHNLGMQYIERSGRVTTGCGSFEFIPLYGMMRR